MVLATSWRWRRWWQPLRLWLDRLAATGVCGPAALSLLAWCWMPPWWQRRWQRRRRLWQRRWQSTSVHFACVTDCVIFAAAQSTWEGGERVGTRPPRLPNIFVRGNDGIQSMPDGGITVSTRVPPPLMMFCGLPSASVGPRPVGTPSCFEEFSWWDYYSAPPPSPPISLWYGGSCIGGIRVEWLHWWSSM